jgi:hypothetical protein
MYERGSKTEEWGREISINKRRKKERGRRQRMVTGWTNKSDAKAMWEKRRKEIRYERHKGRKEEITFPVTRDGSCAIVI